MDGGAVGDGLVGVDALGGFLAEVLLEELLDLGDTGRATNEDDLAKAKEFRNNKTKMREKIEKTHLVNGILLNTSILQHLLNRLQGLPEQVDIDLLELGAGKSLREVIATLKALNLQLSRHLARQSTLGLLDLTLQLAERALVLRDISAGLSLVELDKVVHDAVVKVFSSQVGVSGGGEDLEHTVVDAEERDIECSSSEIVDDDLALATLLVKTVGDGGGGGLVDDTENVETSDGTGILGGLTLGVVEV